MSWPPSYYLEIAIGPRNPTDLEYTTTIESVCAKQNQQDVENLKAGINRVLRAPTP